MTYKPDTLIIAYPNGNTTALVINPSTQTLRLNRKALQSKICQFYSGVEQCGFVFESRSELEMFGGEFCGNATRSAVKILCKNTETTGEIKVSGVPYPLQFWNSAKSVKVQMPVNENAIEKNEIGFKVDLDGISHLVITDSKILAEVPKNSVEFEIWTKNTLKKFKMLELSAAGCTLLYPDNSARFGVWVRDVETVFDETACGSGTCSCGLVLARQNTNITEWSIKQPSGKLINVGKSDGLWWIEGKVDIIKSTTLK